MRAGSASAASLVHPRSEFVTNFVDQALRQGDVPRDGTATKIVSHRTGAPGGIEASRPLSTGGPVQGRRVDDETRVLTAPNGGVRFGVYTGPMTTQTTPALAVSAAPVGPVDR